MNRKGYLIEWYDQDRPDAWFMVGLNCCLKVGFPLNMWFVDRLLIRADV